jgi:arylsulfatase
LHAPADEVKKYKGFFDKGWDVLREQRFKRLKELGIIDDAYVLTDRGVSIPAWKDEPLKEWQIRRMEVYAAMIDVMDQGIGKIISALEAKGVLDNTLMILQIWIKNNAIPVKGNLFVWEKGSCPEKQIHGQVTMKNGLM